jgi:hypothetical protein
VTNENTIKIPAHFFINTSTFDCALRNESD